MTPAQRQDGDGCLAGACADPTVWNLATELNDVCRALPPGRGAVVELFADGHSLFGRPSALYLAEIIRLAAGQPCVQGVSTWHLQIPNSSCTDAPLFHGDRGCVVAAAFAELAVKSDDDASTGPVWSPPPSAIGPPLVVTPFGLPMSAETPNQHPLAASEFDAQFVLQPDGTTAMLHLCANCPGWPANVLLQSLSTDVSAAALSWLSTNVTEQSAAAHSEVTRGPTSARPRCSRRRRPAPTSCGRVATAPGPRRSWLPRQTGVRSPLWCICTRTRTWR